MTATATRNSVGSGLYSLADLRGFVAFSGDRPQDSRRVPIWLARVLLPTGHRAKQPDYSFADLISLFVVRQLLDEGVAPRNIRAAEMYLRQRWEMERPFVRSATIQTDGKHVWVDGEVIPGQIESADQQGQQALLEPIRTSLKHVHFDDGSAAYWVPTKGVLVDPRVQFGEPVLKNSRLTTASTAMMVKRRGIDTAAHQLDIPVRLAKLAVDFEQRLEQARNN